MSWDRCPSSDTEMHDEPSSRAAGRAQNHRVRSFATREPPWPILVAMREIVSCSYLGIYSHFMQNASNIDAPLAKCLAGQCDRSGDGRAAQQGWPG